VDATERVKCKELLNVISDPVSVVKDIIPRRGTIACSGMGQMSTPKVIPEALAKYVEETGEKFELSIYTTGSAAPELDGNLAKVGLISRRYAYQNNPVIREKIDRGLVHYYDIWIGEFGRHLKHGFLEGKCGPVDVAIIEAIEIEEDGSIIPSLSVDHIPNFVELAKKVVIELNVARPAELRGIHDIYLPRPREPIPITAVDQRVGSPSVRCDPKKIAAIVVSQSLEKEVFYGKPTAIEEKIVENLFEFLSSEVAKGRLKKSLYPLQTGIGPVGDLIGSKLVEYDFNNVEVWTEIAQVSYLDALDAGKVSSISGAVLYVPPWDRKRWDQLIGNLSEYKKHVVLRPIEITNSHEMITRFNVISMNQAVEIDIYGSVNMSHILGGNVINGVGGSGEFARAAYLSIFLMPSTARDGKVSRIVPMATHVDIPDHDVDVVITEHGWADLRGLSPRERAKEIIEKCASPDYRDMLWSYFEKACKRVGGHMPHLLEEAFSLHKRFMETGSMK